MNVRHAAALALVGWYLMVPPMDNCVGVIKEKPCADSPLATWSVQSKFSSEAACQENKRIGDEKARGYLMMLAARNRQSSSRASFGESTYMWYLTAKCIASDDPRLKEK